MAIDKDIRVLHCDMYAQHTTYEYVCILWCNSPPELNIRLCEKKNFNLPPKCTFVWNAFRWKTYIM